MTSKELHQYYTMSQTNVDKYEPPSDLKARLAASYDALAPTYNAWTYKHPSPRLAWLKKLLEGLPAIDNQQKSRQILELGAGAGLPTTQAILEHDSTTHVLANDLSPVQLGLLEENLRQYKDRITLQPGDMLSLEYEPESLAAVVGMYSVIHLPQAEQVQLLRKIHGWLQPGGLFLANFGVEDKKEIVADKWLEVDSAWTYWAGLGVQGTLDALADASLQVIEKDIVDGRDQNGNRVDADFIWVLCQKLRV